MLKSKALADKKGEFFLLDEDVETFADFVKEFQGPKLLGKRRIRPYDLREACMKQL